MKKKQQAAPEFTTDADGRKLVHVALANTQKRATLDADEYQRLMDAGWSRHWSTANTGGRFDYVLTMGCSPSGSRRSVTVARLIAQATKGQRITYADGDRTNLLRENLLIIKGGQTKVSANALRPGQGVAPAGAMTPTTPPTPPTPMATSAPRVPFTPRTVNRAALGERVRALMAQKQTKSVHEAP